MKNLLLTGQQDIYPKTPGVDIKLIYKPVNKFLRTIRYLHHKSGILPGLKKFWLGEWINKIADYQKIIIFDSIFDYTPLHYIKKNNPNAIINFCYRNRVHEKICHQTITRNPTEIKNIFNCKIWSYSDIDCKEYNLHHYHQFHLVPEKYYSGGDCIKYDTYFIGTDKERLQDLISLDKTLKQNNISSIIEVIPTKNKKYTIEEKHYLASPRQYDDVLKMALHCKCIIDWVVDLNQGLTFRSLEASVMQKKLITNYKEIKKYEFYNPNNIFIFGEDPINELYTFVNSKFDTANLPILSQYSFKNFCNKILNDSQSS